MSDAEAVPKNIDPLEALPDTFSRRKRRSSGSSDPLRYDQISYNVRMQILHTLHDAIALDNATVTNSSQETFDFLTSFFRRELGVAKLSKDYHPDQEFSNWFLAAAGLEQAVDAIEMICRVIEHMAERSRYQGKTNQLKRLITLINARLMEASIGFQFEAGRVVEANSKYLHSEVIVPTLALLSDPKFAAANAEFLAAHDAYREQDYEQCLVECCKAFESVIKVIAAERSWGVAANAPAKTLVKAVFDNALIPNYMESEFAGIRTVLENGIGTVRNKSGGHGAGTEVRVVPRHLAAFQLHQTGAAITLLAEAHTS